MHKSRKEKEKQKKHKKKKRKSRNYNLKLFARAEYSLRQKQKQKLMIQKKTSSDILKERKTIRKDVERKLMSTQLLNELSKQRFPLKTRTTIYLDG
jgi:hypothetical protein